MFLIHIFLFGTFGMFVLRCFSVVYIRISNSLKLFSPFKFVSNNRAIHTFGTIQSYINNWGNKWQLILINNTYKSTFVQILLFTKNLKKKKLHKKNLQTHILCNFVLIVIISFSFFIVVRHLKLFLHRLTACPDIYYSLIMIQLLLEWRWVRRAAFYLSWLIFTLRVITMYNFRFEILMTLTCLLSQFDKSISNRVLLYKISYTKIIRVISWFFFFFINAPTVLQSTENYTDYTEMFTNQSLRI